MTYYPIVIWRRDASGAVASLADIALDAACAAIQDALGVTDGGFAAHHFSGEEGDAIRAILRRYIAAENAFNVEA